MDVAALLLAAFVLDLLIGDPPSWPHPVRWIGAAALGCERTTRALLPSARWAGIVTAFLVASLPAALAWGVTAAAMEIHPLVGYALAAVLVHTTIAARDLVRHAEAVREALAAGDLAEARGRVARIVGRDTEALDGTGVARAAVESVAESVVDAVTAPLFFALLGGWLDGAQGAAAGAFLYRAVNTLDSSFGYRNERYREFGWASARLDDLANYLPARLTAPLLVWAASVLEGEGAARRAWAVLRRDGQKHPSPNSGLSEAAMAGALGVQLGGVSTYGGVPSRKPTLGDPLHPSGEGEIRRAGWLMYGTAALFLALCLVAALLLSGNRPAGGRDGQAPGFSVRTER